MNLDVLTLIAAGTFTATLSAIFLVGAALQIRTAPALRWWAGSQGALAAGLGLIFFGIVHTAIPAIFVGGVGTTISAALAWAGARSFNRRRVPWSLVILPPVLNLMGGGMAALGAFNAPAVIGFGVASLCLAGAAYEMFREWREPLPVRWPLIGLLLLSALVYAAGVYDVLAGRIHLPEELPPLTSAFGMIHFESLLYSLGATVCMAMLARERSERGYMLAARTDALTGLANRGAFFSRAERLLVRCQLEGLPLSVIVFDLDHFKQVNDRYGHGVGDDVLRVFSNALTSVLRPNDLAGRHGGEEFAVVLPAATVEAAYVIADRVRHAFAKASRAVEELDQPATVSGGVAQAWPHAYFRDVVEAADEALYLAKSRGRDRIARAEAKSGTDDGGIVRVA